MKKEIKFDGYNIRAYPSRQTPKSEDTKILLQQLERLESVLVAIYEKLPESPDDPKEPGLNPADAVKAVGKSLSDTIDDISEDLKDDGKRNHSNKRTGGRKSTKKSTKR